MWPVLSYARFLCNSERELLKRDALKAIDVGVLVEISYHVHRRALFIYELEQLASIALSLSLPAFSASLSLCDLAERLDLASVSASTSSLASASARSSFGFIYNGGIWTTSNFSKGN